MKKENEVVITVVMPVELKVSLQQYAPVAKLIGNKRGASGVIMSVLSKFQKQDGTLDFEKLNKFLND